MKGLFYHHHVRPGAELWCSGCSQNFAPVTKQHLGYNSACFHTAHWSQTLLFWLLASKLRNCFHLSYFRGWYGDMIPMVLKHALFHSLKKWKRLVDKEMFIEPYKGVYAPTLWKKVLTSRIHSRIVLPASWCHTLWTESVNATAVTLFFTSASRWIIC